MDFRRVENIGDTLILSHIVMKIFVNKKMNDCEQFYSNIIDKKGYVF